MDNDPTTIEKRAIKRLKEGDIGGLEMLVVLYQHKAVRMVGLITGDARSAEDIVQNAFIRAGERISQFDDQRPFWPWFLRSIVHDALKSVNRQKRWISIDLAEDDVLTDLVDPDPLPEEMIEKAETNREVRKALDSLPANHRVAIILRYYLEMSEAEIVTTM